MQLPPLILLEDHNGNWSQYIDTVYQCFEADFVKSRAKYDGKRIQLRHHPRTQGKESTFWHLVSDGSISDGTEEEDRLPDLRRCERVGWVRVLIDNAGTSTDIRVWENTRKGKINVCICYGDWEYLVVLGKRNGYTLLLTAYCVENDRKRQLQRDYNKAQAQKSPKS
ncbi:MAG: hypothetical protein KC680_04065 [Candidatus Peregrinibacteria bacterium]|nr:hypothetical protein [Candidatus Peregrinibacteria bacterium]MCB9807783.1 hypothetical protein [Candidatus Peribacteria bacterium]